MMKTTHMVLLAGGLVAGLAVASVQTYAAGLMLTSGAIRVPSTDVLTIADAVSAFDVKASCRGPEVAAVTPGRNLDWCVRSEEKERDQLKKSWSEFPAAAKAECLA